jgi:predicted peroxiredoxin
VRALGAAMARRFVLRLTHAADDVERVGVALTVGSTAIASGIEVELWLVHDAVSLGAPGVVESLRLEHSPPLAELWETIVAAGTVYACSQCLLRRGIGADSLRPGVTQAGAAALVASLAEEGAVALDF